MSGPWYSWASVACAAVDSPIAASAANVSNFMIFLFVQEGWYQSRRKAIGSAATWFHGPTPGLVAKATTSGNASPTFGCRSSSNGCSRSGFHMDVFDQVVVASSGTHETVPGAFVEAACRIPRQDAERED